MSTLPKLKLYNTLTRTKEEFAPLDPANVRMYVCGPTVYDYAHIGNARPMIVFDVLFRLLRHIYGENHVTYARNITDVDDKINQRAFERWTRKRPLLAEMRELTEGTVAQFNKDLKALNVLDPTHTPRATDFVANGEQPMDMVRIIEKLVARGVAYAAEGHVLFSPTAMDKLPGMPKYGALSKRNLDDMLAGARVDVAPYKRDPMDFVLWKPSNPETEPGWASPWGFGRPGWHIECSAMAGALLGEQFDIHGGGIDLVFPHHENEIAQSCCAFGVEKMASIWMHNGFLQVEGKKMSKSDGNFVTIDELLNTTKFGGRSWPREVLRLAMLKTHYLQPIDWTVRALEEAEARLRRWRLFASGVSRGRKPGALFKKGIDLLADDLNTANLLNMIDEIVASEHSRESVRYDVYRLISLIGFSSNVNSFVRLNKSLQESIRFISEYSLGVFRNEVHSAVSARSPYSLKSFNKNDNDPKIGSIVNAIVIREWAEKVLPKIDKLPSDLVIEVEKKLQILMGNESAFEVAVQGLVDLRLDARRAKNFAESDRIRDELAAMGIALKDGKDADGNPTTTWEVKR